MNPPRATSGALDWAGAKPASLSLTSVTRAIVATSTPRPEPPPAAGSLGPRIDFEEIARRLDAELLHPLPRSGRGARLEQVFLRGGDWRHALQVRRSAPDLVISLSEQIGLPLSFVGLPSTRHVMVAHNLTTDRRRAFQRRTRYLQRFDRIIVLSRAQERYLLEEAQVPRERVRFFCDKVDHRFFQPVDDLCMGGYVVSVGREQRDYGTLIDALSMLGTPATIVPSSLWNPSAEIGRRELPTTLTIRQGLSSVELRSLYAAATMVVVPLHGGVDYAAGVNALLEAMAMCKPVIVSDIPGLEGYVEDRVTGRVVPPGDPDELSKVMGELFDDPDEARRLAHNARGAVNDGMNLDAYVDNVVSTAREAWGSED